MDDLEFIPAADPQQIKREKEKARKMRASGWWRKKCASGLCYYCRQQFKPNELTLDHVVPLIRGGRSEKSNMVPCCKECNNKKKHMLPLEWNEYLERLRGE